VGLASCRGQLFEQRDDGGAIAVAVFGVEGIIDTKEIAGVLDQHVLEAASRADERNASLPCRADDILGKIRALVWRAWPNEHTIARLLYEVAIDRVGPDDHYLGG